MESERFDDLIKRLALARSTRLGALRGLAAGALAVVTGATVASESSGAKKRKKKQTICHCAASDPATCQTIHIRKKSAKKHLKHQHDTPGPCPATPSTTTTTTTAAPSPPPTCPTGPCAANSCGDACVCVAIGGGQRRCVAKGTCAGSPCTLTSCGTGCTCINPEGEVSRCVASGSCPVGNCSGDAQCGPGCLCVGVGAASRCASRMI